jgi:hypothetical protein
MLGVQSALADGVVDPNEKIHAMIQQLNAEPSEMARYELASDISRFVQATEDKTRLRDETIDEIAGLLDDRSASMWVAGTLGQIGPAAGRAVPLLEAALDQELIIEAARPYGTGVWLSDVICTALEKIQEMRHPKCRYLSEE